MSEHKPESNGTGRAAPDKASDKASSPSRRRALKAALASAPIIMSIKSRPAFATNDTHPGNNPGNNGINPQQASASLSHNLSAAPGAQPTLKKK